MIVRRLIFDIKLYIASFDAKAWFHLARHDPEFSVYARSAIGIRCYTELFTEHIINDNCEKYTLFNKLHRQPSPTGESLPARIETNGDVKYYINNRLHRNGDLPAVTQYNGTLTYYKNGYQHRDRSATGESQPAYISKDETRYYFQGHLHNDNDQPAVIRITGTIIYYNHGYMHRDHDQPAIIFFDGTLEYYHRGNLHRDNDLPARIYANGTLEYYYHGERHRDGDQPAVIDVTTRSISYYVNGKLHRCSAKDDNEETIKKYVNDARSRHTKPRNGDLPAVIYFDKHIKFYEDNRRWFKKRIQQCSDADFNYYLSLCTQREYIENIFKV